MSSLKTPLKEDEIEEGRRELCRKIAETLKGMVVSGICCRKCWNSKKAGIKSVEKDTSKPERVSLIVAVIVGCFEDIFTPSFLGKNL